MSQPQPVFIFGYTHSGTSLLQGILRRHPDVYSQRSETSFYQFPNYYLNDYPDLDSPESIHGMILFCANLIITGHRRLFGIKSEPFNPNLLTPSELDSIRAALAENPTHRSIFPATFSFLADRDGKKLWVEKTPDHTQQAKQILTEIPDAKAIEIVRDARDILSSKKVREQKLKDKIRNGEATDLDRVLMGYSDYDPFWNGLAWKSAIHAVQNARNEHPERILTIRYEDLTTDPETTIATVCQFLDIEFQPEMLDADQENVADYDKNARKKKAGILSTSVGRYHTTLSRGEQALANRLLFKELTAHGYTVPALSMSDRVLSVFVLLVSAPKIIVRLWNKIKHRGVKHTLQALKNYVKRVLPQ